MMIRSGSGNRVTQAGAGAANRGGSRSGNPEQGQQQESEQEREPQPAPEPIRSGFSERNTEAMIAVSVFETGALMQWPNRCGRGISRPLRVRLWRLSLRASDPAPESASARGFCSCSGSGRPDSGRSLARQERRARKPALKSILPPGISLRPRPRGSQRQ